MVWGGFICRDTIMGGVWLQIACFILSLSYGL